MLNLQKNKDMQIKTTMIKLAAGFVAAVALMVTSAEARAYDMRIHCAEDTVKVSEILKGASALNAPLGQRIVYVAKQLEGLPLLPMPDNDEKGTCMVNMHGFDRLGFVNTVLALAEASSAKLPRVEEFERQYESYTRRKGEDTGFASKLFYGADWIVDNVYRGHIKDMTEYVTGGGFKVKTFDYLTRHRDEFPALKDSATYDKVRMMEMGYRSHRLPHLKKQSITNKSLHELLKDGDILIMLSPEIDYDIYDIGFIEMRNGEPYMIHLSRENDKVTVDEYPVSRLFKLEGQHFYGYRWLRPEE